MNQEWRVLSQKTLLLDRWINVRADSCVTPSGRKIEPYYVLTYPDWVNVVAVTRDDCMVMIRQYRHAANKIILELPGGIVEATDTLPEDAACRELIEETGFRATNMRTVASLYVNPASHTNRTHTCVATGVIRVDVPRLDEGEDGLTVELVPISEVINGLSEGFITQSMHVSSVLLALDAIRRINIKAR